MRDFSDYLKPLWEGTITYDESVMVVENEDGDIPLQLLAYDIEKIISVKNAELTVLYIEGKDYCLQGGMLKILKDGSIFRFKYSEYYPNVLGHAGSYSEQAHVFPTDNGHTVWMEGAFFHKRQIVVTYTHKESDLYKPFHRSKSTVASERLRKKENLTVLFYGDSITFGWNSSKLSDACPYLPDWGKLMVMGLADKYGYKGIIEGDASFPSSNGYLRYINTAVSGTSALWGLNNVEEKVCKYMPDILFLAFGMNNSGTEPNVFKNTLLSIIHSARKDNDRCTVCIVATTLPNPNITLTRGHRELLLPKLVEIEESVEDVVISDMTTMHSKLLKRKPYYHMTGNNVNHPNDFLIRQYATVALLALNDD